MVIAPLWSMAQDTGSMATDTIKVKKHEAEEVIESGEEPQVFVFAEEMPQFPGGQDSMVKFISENLVYPVLAQENNIQGRVVVQFVVKENGEIADVKIVSKALGWGLDEAAVAVVKKMPVWKPGKLRGAPVKVRFVLPIRFRLTNDGTPAKPQK